MLKYSSNTGRNWTFVFKLNFDPVFGDLEDRPILDEAKLFPVFFIFFFFASLDSMNSFPPYSSSKPTRAGSTYSF